MTIRWRDANFLNASCVAGGIAVGFLAGAAIKLPLLRPLPDNVLQVVGTISATVISVFAAYLFWRHKQQERSESIETALKETFRLFLNNLDKAVAHMYREEYIEHFAHSSRHLADWHGCTPEEFAERTRLKALSEATARARTNGAIALEDYHLMKPLFFELDGSRIGGVLSIHRWIVEALALLETLERAPGDTPGPHDLLVLQSVARKLRAWIDAGELTTDIF